MAFNISYIISVTNKFSSPLKQMSVGVKGLAANFKKAASAGGLIDRQFGKIRNTLKNHPLLTIGGAFLVFKQALGTLLNFEGAMNRLSAVTMATTSEMAEMKKVAKELGRTTAYKAGQAAEAMTFLAQAGLNTQQVLEAIPGTLQLAAAGKMDLAIAADIATNVLAAMGMEVSELTRVNDVLSKSQAISNTNVVEMAEAYKTSATIASGLGFEVELLSATIGLMANQGLKGSLAGTKLRRMLTNMSAPLDKARVLYKKLGINIGDFVDKQGKIKDFKGFIGTLSDLDKAGKLSVGTLKDLFGEQGFIAASVLIKAGSKELANFEEKLKAAGGTAKEMADRQMAGLVGTTLRLSSAYEGFTLSLLGSTETGGAISSVIIALTSLLSGLTFLSDEFSWILPPIFFVVGALVAIRIATFAYAFASGQLMSVLTGVRAIILSTAGAAMVYDKAAKIAALTSGILRGAFVKLWLAVAGPVGWIIMGVTAFSAVVYGVYKNWELVISSIKKAASALMFWKGEEGKEITAPSVGTASGIAPNANTQTSRENVAGRFDRFIRQPVDVTVGGEIGVTASGGAEIVNSNISMRTGAAY